MQMEQHIHVAVTVSTWLVDNYVHTTYVDHALWIENLHDYTTKSP